MKKIFFLLSAFVAAHVSAQTYDFRNFNVEDGLAQSQVLSMCQDHFGNIWFGTNSGGVSKYDGNKFTNYTENDSLVNNVIFSITETRSGEIFFGTNGGLSIYNGRTFHNLKEKDGLPHNRVFKILEDASGIIWIGTAKGVCQYRNGKIIPFTADSLLANSNVFTMFDDDAGNIWFGTIEHGLIKYNVAIKRFSVFNKEGGLHENFIRSINQDLQGNIYVGTVAGINKINKSGIIQHVSIPKEENLGFVSILTDNRNNLWLSTNEGLYKYNGYSYRLYKDKNGLASNKLLCSMLDREGNFWFGTDGFGVSKFAGEAFTSYSVKDSLPGDYITTAYEDSKKQVWLGIKGFGAVKFLKGKMSSYRLNPKDPTHSLADNEVYCVLDDGKGSLFFGTKAGLSILDAGGFHNYHVKDGLPDDIIFALYRDANGLIWICTQNGLCTYRDGRFTTITAINKFKSERGNIPVYYICQDKNGSYWLASEKGVIRYDGKNAQSFSRPAGFTDKRTTSIFRDGKEKIWFGTDEGVYCYDYSTFKNIGESTGLSSNKVYLLQSDGLNNLWIGTNKGLDRLSLPEYYSQNKIVIKHYGKEEGLSGVECNSNACMQDGEGNLWFGTIKGVTVFNPRYDPYNRQEALTRITGIRLFFQNTDLAAYSTSIDSLSHLPENLVLPHDKNHITFDFIGICITNPNKVRYQFRLEGADNDWFPPTSKTEATYSSLPAGEYTFFLKAMNNDGKWNEKPVSFRFSILPPWWKTWWFYTMITLAMTGSIYLFIVVRTRNLQRAKVELEQEVQLRTFQLRQEKEKVEVVNREVLEQKAIIEAKNHDITDSIKYAKNIQEALLPPLQNIHREFRDAFVLYLPKDIVSGDFYWFAKRNNKRFIASVDCTGHGVPGAFMSIIGNTLLNEIVADKNISQPAEILNELHIGVKTALKQNNTGNERRDGMDIALCMLNEDSTELQYAGANRPLWIFRKNKAGEETFEMIRADKFPIGGLEMENEEKRQFTNHKIEVKEGDMIYIFSDGYADQFGGERGKKLMVGNMQKFITAIWQKPVREQEELLVRNFLEWKRSLEQVDDVLVIGFRI